MPLIGQPSTRHHGRIHEPWSLPLTVVLPVVLGPVSRTHSFPSISLWQLHGPFHDPWSSPLSMKWLVKMILLGQPQGNYCLSHRKPLHKSWSSPLAMVVKMGHFLARLGSLGPLLVPLHFTLAFVALKLSLSWPIRLRGLTEGH